MRGNCIRCLSGIFLLAALLCPVSRAQETYFYRLTGIVVNGTKRAPNTTSKLFVTFSKNVCYDSDREGFIGKYGQLTLSSETDQSYKYSGNCYFGYSDYVVSRSKDLINIWSSDGKVYIYTRETPPSNVKDCSYGNLVCHYVPEKAPAPVVAPVAVPDNSGGSGNPSSGRSGSTREPDCPVCHGNGKCSYCAGRGWKIIGDTVQDCIICRGTGRCTSCHGSGKCR